MANIIDYINEWGKYSFLERPLNEADNLVLSQLSYLHYEGFVPELNKRSVPVGIRSIYEDEDRDRILRDYWYRENNKELFELAALSRRFGTMKMDFYVNLINEDEEMQFSAMTYILEDKSVYMAYRGTDATIVGWKEDLNMAFSKPLRSQQLAVEYMERAASYISGDFYAGGHSKGGNLAVYAAMNCSERTRGRLLRVYSNDGPGFRPEIREIGNFKEIEDRVCKFIPRSSLVGMILEEHGNYEIVDSKAIGMLQHNTYTWKIEDGSFVRVRNMTGAKILRDAALNEWILSLPQEEIHAFVDTLYEVVSASEAFSVFDFGADWKRCLQHVLKAAREVDDATRKTIQKMLRSLFEILLENVKQGSAKY